MVAILWYLLCIVGGNVYNRNLNAEMQEKRRKGKSKKSFVDGLRKSLANQMERNCALDGELILRSQEWMAKESRNGPTVGGIKSEHCGEKINNHGRNICEQLV